MFVVIVFCSKTIMVIQTSIKVYVQIPEMLKCLTGTIVNWLNGGRIQGTKRVAPLSAQSGWVLEVPL